MPEKRLLGVGGRCPVIFEVNNKDLNFEEKRIIFFPE